MNKSESVGFCEDQFWDSSLLLNNTWPQFTSCFINTILVWVPCGYMWLLLPYFLYDISNELSTNNLQPTRHKETSRKLKYNSSRIANGGTLETVEESPVAPLTTVCVFKMTLTFLLAVLSLIRLLFSIKDNQTTSDVLAWSLYLATYLLTAFELWYERRKGRNPMMMSFYFYTMNLIVGIVPLYTWIKTEEYLRFRTEFGVQIVVLVVNLLCFLLSFMSDNSWKSRKHRGYEQVGETHSPEFLASYPSQIFFLWMKKLMVTGFSREITVDDLWDLHPRDMGRRLNPLFDSYWKEEKNKVNRINSAHFFELNNNSRNSALRQGTYGRSGAYFDGASERTSLLITEDLKIIAEIHNARFAAREWRDKRVDTSQTWDILVIEVNFSEVDPTLVDLLTRFRFPTVASNNNKKIPG